MSTALSIILLSVILLYALYIRRMESLWNQIPVFNLPRDNQPVISISVLVPYRNELNNLRILAKHLRDQDYPHHLVQFILIDDNSTDGSLALARMISEEDQRFVSLSLQGAEGKKRALQKGLMESTGQVIVTTDADTRLKAGWLQNIAGFYQLEEPLLIIMPVMFSRPLRYYQQLALTEWFALTGLTGASANNQRPLMCSGANLAIDRIALLESGGYSGHSHVSSGDDMFILKNISRYGTNSIKYLWNEEVIAETNPPGSLKEWISQRIRWSSKMKHVLTPPIIISGAIIYVANLVLLFVFILGLFRPVYMWLFVPMLGIKCIADHSLLVSVSRSFRLKISEMEVLILAFIYPFYLVLLPVISIFYTPRWKGRKINV